jgi:hypothetical protein
VALNLLAIRSLIDRIDWGAPFVPFHPLSYPLTSGHLHADLLTITDRLVDPGTSPRTTNDSGPSTFTSPADSFLSTPNPLGLQAQDLPPLSQVTHQDRPQDSPAISPFLPPSHQTNFQHRQQSSPLAPRIATTNVSQPIQIPIVTFSCRDPNCVSTPVSARGERTGHLFPYSRTPSPHGSVIPSSPSKSHSSTESDDFPSGWARGRRRSSSSNRSRLILNMRAEQYSGRYIPTSPLSPRLPSSSRPQSPQPGNLRPTHARQTSRNLHMTLPRYHPANFQHHGPAATPTPTVQSPAITLNRVNQPSQMDSPRIMREKQRELLEGARLFSTIAASPAGQKPGSPRLGPLGSPKGPVTPLALEDSGDYFSVAGAGTRSPAVSPGAKSDRSSPGDASGNEDGTTKKQRKVDVYQ